MTPIPDSTRIRLIIALLGLTCKEFAELVGVRAATLSGWTSGRATPHPENRDRMAKICQDHKIGFMPYRDACTISPTV